MNLQCSGPEYACEGSDFDRCDRPSIGTSLHRHLRKQAVDSWINYQWLRPKWRRALEILQQRQGSRREPRMPKTSWSNSGAVIVSHRSKHASGSHPCRVVSVSYEQMGCCNGRGRGFKSRYPRNSFQALATLAIASVRQIRGDVRGRWPDPRLGRQTSLLERSFLTVTMM